MTSTRISPEQKLALDHARHLVEFGVPVFIAKPARTRDGEWDSTGGSSDTGYHLPEGWQDFDPNPDVLDDWQPGWAVCAVMGHGVDGLDVDPRNGGDDSLAQMQAEGSVPRSYGRQRTPSGGMHDLIASLAVRSKNGVLPGVDVKAGDPEGNGRGFLFIAPTERVSKATGEIRAYEWATPPDLTELELVGADDTGEALAALVRGGKPAVERSEKDFSGRPTPDQVDRAEEILDSYVRNMRTTVEGVRNDRLIELLPTLFRFVLGGCLDETEVDERMREAAAEAGIGVAEYDKVSQSAWGYARTDGPDRPESAADVFDAVSLDDLFDATPTLSTIRQAAHSRLVGAPSLLCYVLARVLAEVPPSVSLPPVVGGRASLNLGIAVVGGSGAGKSALLSVSRELLGLTGAWQEDIERNLGSGEGLAQQFLWWDSKLKTNHLIHDPRRILTVDEIDQLGATKNRNGATIAPTIRSALTGDPLGQANATADRNRHLLAGSYRLVLVLGVQPTRSDTLLEDADACTPQRLVWVNAMDPTLPDEDVEWPGPLHWELPARLPELIDYPDHIKAEVRAARRAQTKSGADALAGHKLLTRLKVATALALLHGEQAITDQWWSLAGQIIDASVAAQADCKRVLSAEVATRNRNRGRLEGIREEGAAEYRNEKVEAAAKAIWKQVHKHAHGTKDSNQKHEPGEGCTGRCVTNALRNFADRNELRDRALETAQESDWIVETKERWFPGDSRPA